MDCSEVERFIEKTHAEILYGGNEAFYETDGDYIQVPEQRMFIDTENGSATEHYYATLLHELTHWTGHAERCNRNLKNRFGDQAYAFEELIAELGAAFLCADLQVRNCYLNEWQDATAYIASCLKVLKFDSKAIFDACVKAAEAVAYLHNLQI